MTIDSRELDNAAPPLDQYKMGAPLSGRFSFAAAILFGSAGLSCMSSSQRLARSGRTPGGGHHQPEDRGHHGPGRQHGRGAAGRTRVGRRALTQGIRRSTRRVCVCVCAQVANYGVGGQYEPHFDFGRVSNVGVCVCGGVISESADMLSVSFPSADFLSARRVAEGRAGRLRGAGDGEQDRHLAALRQYRGSVRMNVLLKSD